MNEMFTGNTHRFFKKKIKDKIIQLCPDAITHVETHHPVAALTFDDGPHPVYTPILLSILKKHGANATFFMVGVRARRYPEIVKKVAQAGHAIGNHSWDHPNLRQIQQQRRRVKQMWACARATAPYCNRLFRPPFGQQNDTTRIDALIFRYNIILWSASAQDWLHHRSYDITQKIIDRVTPGSIFLLHDAIYHKTPDTQADRKPMLEGLDTALASLKGKYNFVTIPDLLRTGRPVCNWPRNN